MNRLPFEWDDESDHDRFWFWDEVHCPVPYSPLTMTAHAPLIAEGMIQAASDLCMPFDGTDLRFFHGYLYHAPRPLKFSEEEKAKRLQMHSEIMVRKVSEFPEEWERGWLPELASFHAFQKGVSLGKLNWKELDSYRRRTLDIDWRRWTIHFTFWFTFGSALGAYLTLYQTLSGETEEANAYTLLQGFENKTTEANQELWKLASAVRDSPDLTILFEQSHSANILDKLAGTEEGARFQADLRRFLETFGYRTASFPDIADVTWLEDPTPVFIAVQQCLRPDFPNPRARQEGLAREREDAIEKLRPQTEGCEEFFRLLHVVQKLWPITESHQFYLDQPSIVHSRFLYLEYGRRFAEAGSLAALEDVFYLTKEELLQTSGREGKGDLRSLVHARQRQMGEWKNFQPPPFLGTPPSGEEEMRDPALERVFGLRAGTRKEIAKEIRGISGAPGQATGVVRVLRSTSQGGELQPGEILVAKTTTPTWTPLFGVAAALITDSGGVLCHGAIVAREYGIPAVVGTHGASRILKDGDRVLVDGTEGKVTLLGQEPA